MHFNLICKDKTNVRDLKVPVPPPQLDEAWGVGPRDSSKPGCGLSIDIKVFFGQKPVVSADPDLYLDVPGS